MVKINGAQEDAAGINLSEYLKKEGYNTSFVAVECNGEIIPKAEYDAKILADGDSIEVVSFVGGG